MYMGKGREGGMGWGGIGELWCRGLTSKRCKNA